MIVCTMLSKQTFLFCQLNTAGCSGILKNVLSIKLYQLIKNLRVFRNCIPDTQNSTFNPTNDNMYITPNSTLTCIKQIHNRIQKIHQATEKFNYWNLIVFVVQWNRMPEDKSIIWTLGSGLKVSLNMYGGLDN